MIMPDWSLTARWVFPVDGPPLLSGIVVIDNDKIAAVEPQGTRSADMDLGNVAIIPGLVNAHTHLDLTGMRGKCPPTPDFTQWLRGVIAYRRQQTPQDIEADIRAGLAQCLAAGTTLVGDIAAQGQSWSELASATARSVVFYEFLGIGLNEANKSFDAACAWLDSCGTTATCRAGLSPHAPYSTNWISYEVAAREAGERGIPLATHLAESSAETELLTSQIGPFVDFLKDLAVWTCNKWTVQHEDYIKICHLYARQFLLVHCNYLPPATWIPREATIIYCPRTHAAFGHPPHPFQEFLKCGVRVALGTDSLASNPDLSILSEMRFIHQRYPDFPGDVLLRMGTLAGAEALGWADETGSLSPGKSADLAVVPLPDEEGEPHELLFGSEHPVSRTMFRGQWVSP
jgi:cytosine/adenosine deaminase-related metal-dependent hydrolase